jgi:FtsP/CotA-like multicopper oxidase with cupredoxin domain
VQPLILPATMCFVLLLLVLAVWPSVVFGTTVYVDLTVDICRYEEHVSFNARCYNDKFQGPTITVKQGDTLKVTLRNNLGSETGDDEDNEVHWPNTTALHFHGLHASPAQDNILKTAGPGETVELEIYIEEDHYPGTHWYHAHYHGSSHYQVMGGLFGAFIIEPRNPYPQFIAEMNEILLVASNLKIWAWDNGEWLGYYQYWDGIGDEIDLDLVLDTSKYNNTFVFNGKYQPSIDIAVNEWNWLRVINAGNGLMLPIRFNSTFCEHYVIGVDGVFLDEPISNLAYYVLSGSRFDFAVRCTELGNHSVQFFKDPDNVWLYYGVDSADKALLLNLQALRVHEGASLPLEKYEAPEKPSYLDSLMEVPTEDIAGRFTVYSEWYDSDNDQFALNGEIWQGTTNSTIFTMELGKVYEITFTTQLAVHPIHIHTNNFQIINDTQVAWSQFDTFSVHYTGTWRDVIYSVFERNVTVRIRPDRYIGFIPIHCHYLIHSDRGMMREIEILPNTDDQLDEQEEAENS